MVNLNESIKDNLNIARSAPRIMLHFTPGIWINEKCYWLQDCQEKVIYQERMILKVKKEPIHSKIQLFHLYVSNRSHQDKHIKILAMHHHSRFLKEHFSFVTPSDHIIFHLANQELYMVNGQYNGTGIKEYTIQPHWNVFTDKIWSCLEKGHLQFQPMMKGPAASIFTLEANVSAHASIKLNTWIMIGTSKRELLALDRVLKKHTSISI